MQETRIISRALWASLMILCLICPADGYAKDKPAPLRGMRVLLHVEPEHIDSVLSKLQKRLEEAGIENPAVEKTGDEIISIKLPGVHDIQHIRRLVEERGFVQWILVAEDVMQKAAYAPRKLQRIYDRVVSELEKNDESTDSASWTFEELDSRLHELDLVPADTILRIWERKDSTTGEVDKIPLLLRSTQDAAQVVSGDELKPEKVVAKTDAMMTPIINFEMKLEAAKRFGQITKEYNSNSENAIAATVDRTRGWRMAILIDNRVITAPVIQSEILHGKGVIIGFDSMAEAKDVAAKLKSGSLPVKPTIKRIHYVLKQTKETWDRQSDE